MATRCRIFTLAFSQTSASECNQKHSHLLLSTVGGFLVLRLVARGRCSL